MIRAGYTVFYESNFLWESQGIRGQWPYALSDNPTGTNKGTMLTPIQTFFAPDLDVTPWFQSKWNICSRPGGPATYTQQWNIGVQHELATDSAFGSELYRDQGNQNAGILHDQYPTSGPGESMLVALFLSPGALVEDNRKAYGNYNGLQVRLTRGSLAACSSLVLMPGPSQLIWEGMETAMGPTRKMNMILKLTKQVGLSIFAIFLRPASSTSCRLVRGTFHGSVLPEL